MFGGATKKKITAVDGLITAAEKEISQKQKKLIELDIDIDKCEKSTALFRVEAENGDRDKGAVDTQKQNLGKELEAAEAETEQLKERIVKAKEATAEAQAERARLAAELAGHGGAVREEHSAAEAAAEAAGARGAALQAEQEEARLEWHGVREAHERLREKAEEGQQKFEEAKARRDAARESWMEVQDQLHEQEMTARRLDDQRSSLEEELGRQKAQNSKLEKHLNGLKAEQGSLQKEGGQLTVDHKQRQFVLESVSENLTEKRAALERQLGEFQEQFNKAKAHRDRVVEEQARLREDIKSFVPEHFKLQTEHLTKTKELEQARRRRELLNWERYKMHRDLQVLAQSYEVGSLAHLFKPSQQPQPAPEEVGDGEQQQRALPAAVAPEPDPEQQPLQPEQ